MAVPSVVQFLLDYANRLQRSPAGWRAVVINLSRLRADNRGTHRLRIAASTFESLVKQYEGRIFVLPQGDIVFICKDANAAAVEGAVGKVRVLFNDDPLAAAPKDGQAAAFATWFDLAIAASEFLAFAQAQQAEEEKRHKAAGSEAVDERQPMDPQALHELINAIARADLSSVLRRQSVCSIAAGAAPKPLYRELFISIADLRKAVMPQRDIASDRWLFHYLTQTLDRRVLALLRKADDSDLTHSYSLNLNVSTLLSPEFHAFDSNLRAGARGSIVIEIETLEIFADLGAYVFARDFVRERGYRVCIDGLSRLTLPFIDRARLGVDLLKVIWSPDMIEGENSDKGREFMSAIERVGKARIILARCDTEQAIAFGHKVGIGLFQGRYVERQLANSGNSLIRTRLAAPQAQAR